MSSTNDQDFGAYHPANPADTWKLTRNEHVADVDTYDNLSKSSDTDALPESPHRDGSWVQSIGGTAWLGQLHNGACNTPDGCTHQDTRLDDDFRSPGHLVIKDPYGNYVVVAPISSWTQSGRSAASMLVQTDEQDGFDDGMRATVDGHKLVFSDLDQLQTTTGPDRVYTNGQPQSLCWTNVQIRVPGDSLSPGSLSVDPQIAYRSAAIEEMISTPTT